MAKRVSSVQNIYLRSASFKMVSRYSPEDPPFRIMPKLIAHTATQSQRYTHVGIRPEMLHFILIHLPKLAKRRNYQIWNSLRSGPKETVHYIIWTQREQMRTLMRWTSSTCSSIMHCICYICSM
ncbi:hypothetical protein TcasGA2_TC013499 [Tribolium castaneum]|uniref:Uncharacterized protein n=1 Tax=Tribolium castaneum TaxID=7070 RepID=D6WL68_TRICA|nr:hypothetical protein TcasGA2_TC013499 [Tribolium castaneum]